MIGRADIEGSKSNVAMGAWLPQASSLIPRDMMQTFPSALTSLPLGMTVISLLAIIISDGSSMYLKPWRPTPYHALNRSVHKCFTRVGCWSSNPLNCLPYSSKYCTMRCYHHRLAFRALRTSQHPGVLLASFPLIAVPRFSGEITMSDTDVRHCLTWRWGGLIARDWWLVG